MDKAIPNEQLRQAREDKGWTQSQVAEMIGAKPNNYSRWERGRAFPSDYYRKKLSKLFEKRLEELWLVRQAPRKKSSSSKINSPIQISPTIPYADREMLLTPILGREQEIADILKFLQQDQELLVTITGTGGVGKTRLALEVVAHLKEHYQFTSIYVSLASLQNGSDILPAFGKPLGLREPISIESVISALKAKPASHILVVLDNFEHVITENNRNVLIDLLTVFKDKLQLLVTSRIALKTQSEKLYPLHPLKSPQLVDIKDPKDLEHYPATQLYLKTAKRIKDDFKSSEDNAAFIVNVCRLLDGLPLAIILVASRIKTHPPELLYQDLLRNLFEDKGEKLKNDYYVNVPERQMTLYQTFEWTYNLLGKDQRKLFRRLSIFGLAEEFPMTDIFFDPVTTKICSINEDLLEYLELDRSKIYWDGYEDRYVLKLGKMEQIIQSLVDFHLLEEKELTSDELDDETRAYWYWAGQRARGLYMLLTIHEYARQKLIDMKEYTVIQESFDYYTDPDPTNYPNIFIGTMNTSEMVEEV